MRETDAILQSLLLNHRKAKTVKECITAVEAMCTKENLDAIEAILAKDKENQQ
ncbi:MAG: hypothetical protein FWH20_09010 [Oscillospiraceae bacterium]|nr:hypothetical protein [Oscillospiraceae bacterium]